MGQLAHGDGSWDFEKLMQELAGHSKFSADFVEYRSSLFLSRPLKIFGRIAFDAGSRMEKEVMKPFSERIIIDETKIVIIRKNLGGKEENEHAIQYSLAKYPFLAKAIKGVTNLFAGNKELLDELYYSELSGAKDAWELVLKPRSEKLAEFISAITVRGNGGIIDYVHTLEADDDESKMTLSNRMEG